jgi:site-specific recombinase XerC
MDDLAVRADVDPDLRAAVDYALASKAPGTLRAYDADWRHFAAWCDRRGATALPAAPATVAAYLAAHARGSGGVRRLRLTTLQRRLAAIGAYHSAGRRPNPVKTPEVQATWHGIRREHGWSQDAAAPAVTEVLRRLLATCDTRRYIGLRDRAMLLIGFAALLRRSELVALDVTDLMLVPDGLEVHVGRTRSRAGPRGDDVRAVPYGRHAETCPVKAWLAWRDAAGLTEGPAFRPVHPRLRISVPDDGAAGAARAAARRRAAIQAAPRLTDLAVYRAVQTAARRANLAAPRKYRGHSLRAGAAVQAAPLTSDAELAAAGGWATTDAVRRYTAGSRIWDNPVAGRLGL